MKKMKRIMCSLLAAVMVLSVGFAVNGTETKAADSDPLQAPKTVRCGIGYVNDREVTIPVASKTGDIKNIKVLKGKKKTKQLVARKVRIEHNDASTEVQLNLYAKKAGTYTVKYDVYADGKKVGKTQKFTVRASGYGTAISTVKINKKNVTKFNSKMSQPTSFYTTKNKVKVNFKAAKGCKIKKIEMIYYGKDGKQVVKKVKNGKKVTLNKYGSTSSYSDSDYGQWNRSEYAYTYFKVTYTDKYAQYKNKEDSEVYSIAKRASKWSTRVYQDSDIEW